MWQDVVPLRSPRRQELVADPGWERKIGEAAAMQVAQFTPADAELEAAEPMRAGDDAIPRRDFLSDLRRRRMCHMRIGALARAARITLMSVR